MKRLPETELMDGYEQAKAYAEADFEEPNSLFVNLFKKHFPWIKGRFRMVDLGCGPADICVRLAREYPEAEIHAVDGSAAMLQFARERLHKEKLQHRIKLIKACLPEDPLPSHSYDVLISNSLLHHLTRAEHLWNTIKKYGSKGSLVLIMDLIRPATIDKAREIVQTYAVREPEILKRDFFNSLCAAYTLEEVRRQISDAGLHMLEVKTVTDRHMLVAGRL